MWAAAAIIRWLLAVQLLMKEFVIRTTSVHHHPV
jgi:hypothetical protein